MLPPSTGVGGARAHVKDLNVLQHSIIREWQENGKGVKYSIPCRWRVDGVVLHWGHTHMRSNEYVGTFQMSPE